MHLSQLLEWQPSKKSKINSQKGTSAKTPNTENPQKKKNQISKQFLGKLIENSNRLVVNTIKRTMEKIL